MDPLARLEAIDAIRQLKARYFRCMDCKQWDDLAALFMHDMQVITPAGEIYCKTGDAYAAALRKSLETANSFHQGFTAEIEILSCDTARGVWAMQDIISWPDRHPVQGWKRIVGRGHYHETYRHEHGKWRIATLTLTRLSLDVEWPADDPRATEKAQ